MQTEISKLLDKTYKDCCEYFKNKYGPVPRDYFANKECRSKPNSGHGYKGLQIHHFDEDKAIMLSTRKWALENPFSYQKADRLLYCNLLEHLLLHIKITEYPNKYKNKEEQVGIGGVVNFLIPQLNDIYSGIKYKKKWMIITSEKVLPLKNDYLLCLKYFIKLKPQYCLDPYLKTSFDEKFGNWDKKNNAKIFQEIEILMRNQIEQENKIIKNLQNLIDSVPINNFKRSRKMKSNKLKKIWDYIFKPRK